MQEVYCCHESYVECAGCRHMRVEICERGLGLVGMDLGMSCGESKCGHADIVCGFVTARRDLTDLPWTYLVALFLKYSVSVCVGHEVCLECVLVICCV